MYLRHCKDKKKNKPKSSRCREIITIKAELNEVEVKKKNSRNSLALWKYKQNWQTLS